jgi:glycosyltransferase involved in cell wall biosynthesis
MTSARLAFLVGGRVLPTRWIPRYAQTSHGQIELRHDDLIRPRVTIGLPVYNGERYLRETLESLLSQRYEDFELVISDNASTDSTLEICQTYADRDPRIRLLRWENNRGAAANYNRVLHAARGQYFRWNAADDYCDAETLSRCVAVLDSQPAAVLAFPITQIIDENSQVVRGYDDGLHAEHERVPDRFRFVLNRIAECNAVFGLIRKDALWASAGIGAYVASDGALLAELSLQGKFIQISDGCFFRRDHPEASSSDKSLAAQLAFFDPRIESRIFLRHWRHLWENLKAVRRAPLGTSDKLLCAGLLLRMAVGARDKMAAELSAGFRQWRSQPRRK